MSPLDPGRRGARAVWAIALALIVALLGALGRAPAARAAALPGPAALGLGFADDNVFLYGAGGAPAPWFARAQQLGSQWVRIGVYWSQIAPTAPGPGFAPADPADPQYDFSGLDAAVGGATAHGQRVLLTFFHPPAWAQSPGRPASALPGTWRPSAAALGAFARAVVTRYSGRFADPTHPGQALPRVSAFQAWNEPNLSTSITPQWVRGRRGRWVAASPGIYRAMLNAVYASVKAVAPRAFVLSAGTAPYGDPPGGARMHPVTFTQDLLCLSGRRPRRPDCADPPHFDGLDHHPYALTPTLHAFQRDDVSVPDLGRLTRLLRQAERIHAALPRGRKQFWMTEIFWTSRPPDPNGIPLSLQARYLSLSFYELWRQGIDHVFWFLIRDAPYKSLRGAGVYFADGTAKPSAAAFRFPFVAVAGRAGTVALWGRAPGRGVVTVQARRGRTWRTVARLHGDRAGIFHGRRRLARHLVLRARIGPLTSLPYAER